VNCDSKCDFISQVPSISFIVRMETGLYWI